MNLTSLRTFVTIVEAGSLVRASKQLNVTQSTVTARLKSLEQDLGQTLVHRHKSGVRLTPAGSKLIRYAKIMSGLWQQARHEAGLPEGTDLLVNFGCHTDLWQPGGKTFFDHIIGQHESIALSVFHGGQLELEQALADGLVDIVLSYQPFARDSQTVYSLAPEQLILYSDRIDSPIKFDPLYVFVDHGEEYRRFHAEHYHDAGTARINFDSSQWGLEYLLEQGGSAYLPEKLAQKYVESGHLHVLSQAPCFSQKRYVVASDSATENWPWFEDVLRLM